MEETSSCSADTPEEFYTSQQVRKSHQHSDAAMHDGPFRWMFFTASVCYFLAILEQTAQRVKFTAEISISTLKLLTQCRVCHISSKHVDTAPVSAGAHLMNHCNF